MRPNGELPSDLYAASYFLAQKACLRPMAPGI
jgi:hypothetical protein